MARKRPNENPFIPDEPVREPGDFFGRRQEIADLSYCLRRGQCAAVVGPLKIGKTSLLYQIVHPAVLDEHGIEARAYRFVYIDGRALSDKSRTESFGYLVRKVLSDQDHDHDNWVNPFAELQSTCRRLKRSGVRLVLILDSLDEAGSNPKLGSSFFDPLRSLNSQYEVFFLTASEHPLFKVASKAVGDTGSPFFNIFKPFNLEPLSADESLDLLRAYLSRVFAGCSDEFLARVVARSAGHPHRLQRMGWQLVERWIQNGKKWDRENEEAFLHDLDRLAFP